MQQFIKEAYTYANKSRIWFLVGSIAILIAIEITATVAIPLWREYFFDGVEAKSYPVFINGMWLFAALMTAFVISQGFKQFTLQKLGLEWRTALNNMLLARWKKSGLPNIDNPDQRISEDTNIASMLALELIVEVIISASIIAGLVGSMSGTLLALSAAYTVVISGIAVFFHRPLIDSEKGLQRAEADYRFNLAKTVNDGKEREVAPIYKAVMAKYSKLINVTLGFNLFSRAKGNLMTLIPYALLVPMYFADEIGFGEVMKGVSQFDLLVINATILIILYPKVTKALASYERIKEFYDEVR